MPERNVLYFWMKLADDKQFRLRFLECVPDAIPGFLLSEDFEFSQKDLDAILAMRLKFGTSSTSRSEIDKHPFLHR